MSLIALFSRRLYVRIWLAVVVGVAVLTLLVGWAWRVAAETKCAAAQVPQGREMVLRDSAGNTLVAGLATRAPGSSRDGAELRIDS